MGRWPVKYHSALRPATLRRRYKRFLADVVTESGDELTVHCPNTGAMTGCADPGSRIWYSTTDNPKRKYAHTLEIVESAAGDLICVNSAFANALVREALDEGWLTELGGYSDHAREVAVPDAPGRFDFRLTDAERPPCYVEVKSVTLCGGLGGGVFPDAVSARATRHVEALQRRVAVGDRAVLLFCAQHTGITRVGCAGHIDPAYAAAVHRALEAGVEVVAYGARITTQGACVKDRLPFTPPSETR